MTLILLTSIVPVAYAAPSGEIFFPDGQVSSVDNILEVGDSEEVVVTFRNTAGPDIDDVESTLRSITLAAVLDRRAEHCWSRHCFFSGMEEV